MSKHGWMLWVAPAAIWAVYMCWLTGYQSGYEQGHSAAWASARAALVPPPKSVILEQIARIPAPELSRDDHAIPVQTASVPRAL